MPFAMPSVFSLLLSLFLLLPVSGTFAQQGGVIETEHAEAELESDVSSIQPGEPFWLSLEFELEPHWHIYWKNPGDSGLAPQLKWTLPDGFRVGAIHWPAPKQLQVEGLVNYGYEGIVRLLVPVTPPKMLDAKGEYQFTLDASWLICSDICIPEKGSATITLPANTSGEPLYTDDADGIRQTLSGLPTIVKETGSYTKSGSNWQLRMALPTTIAADTIKSAYFYADEGGVIDHAAAQNYSVEGQTLTVSAKAGSLPVPDNRLSGVLEVISTPQQSHYFAVDFTGDSVEVATPVANTTSTNPAGSPVSANHADLTSSSAPTGDAAPIPALLQALFFAFLGGMLLNAMPCVFPVLSLKALAISKKAAVSPASVKRQGLAYLLGVVISFLFLGALLIGLKQSGQHVGWGFQLQSPGFVAGLIYLFTLLGLSLSGMFELPAAFSGSGQKLTEKDSISGSFFTGVLAVIVATPCTVPFMAPAIGYAFVQPPATTLLIMVALGLGLAFPYLAISFYPPLRNRLPRPGAWMVRFKELMAFFLYATAVWLLWVLTQQVGADGLAMVLGTALAILFLIWLGKGRGTAWRWVLSLLAVTLIIYSILPLHSTPDAESANAAHRSHYAQEVTPFDPEILEQLRAEGKPVFVNATAAWCITCKVNERLALRSDGMAKAMQEKNITYMIADWTNYDDRITKFLQDYGRQGVPLYVFFPAQGEPVVLPQLLTESLVINVINGE